MDYNILELLLNSNPASATALLAVLILFFYNLFKKFDKKAIKMIKERIKNIENSDIDGKLELLYLKKDIEAIKRYMDVHYLSNITFRNSRNKKE